MRYVLPRDGQTSCEEMRAFNFGFLRFTSVCSVMSVEKPRREKWAEAHATGRGVKQKEQA